MRLGDPDTLSIIYTLSFFYYWVCSLTVFCPFIYYSLNVFSSIV
jgi:hypothetical protein